MNELALFAGAGGGILGGKLLGWRTVCAVEIDRYARNVLLSRQNDGCLNPFPIWDDIRTFEGEPWRGLVDVVSGGFPCQDISVAGKGVGITGEKSGLWREMYRIICEVRPRYAFMENSPAITARGLGTVLGDLAEAGYDAAWVVLGADDLGAPHVRKRWWCLAHDPHTNRMQCPQRSFEHERAAQSAGGCEDSVDAWQTVDANSDVSGRQKQEHPIPTPTQLSATVRCGWWDAEPAVGRVADGVAHRVDRLRCLGNGQVPCVAARAFELLFNSVNNSENKRR